MSLIPIQRPLWLDCDTGHDDAFAILLAARHPDLKLLGISTVHGNASLENTTINTLSILKAVGREDVPVYPGAAKPFCRSTVYAPDIHGSSGLDGTTCLPSPSATPVTEPKAIHAMYDALMRYPGSAWLVATGALTNVALLFAIYPELVTHIQGLSIMGGAIGSGFTDAPMGHVRGEGLRFGNHTSYAEFNIYCDPEAAKSIFSNSTLAAKTTLITLDLSHQVLASVEVQQLLVGDQRALVTGQLSNVRHLFYQILVFFAHTYRDVFGLTKGPPLHDPLAVAILLDGLSEVIQFNDNGGERWHVNVVTDGLHSDLEAEQGQVGRTMLTQAEEGGVRIPRALDRFRFWQILDECLERAEKALSS
ncbi:hypothetical protein JMJ35_007603 [Cladonia borealis]|uniref:Inosine/uridine-preferring nucleoside hydrolase domain-containing protein n=1 Tax=Cladonia borealis TaxID=184061 RepID=A0AA39V3Q3_9LECA|nr:hypothetical protein JMJ35_007603 [Cladonia borealis]